MLQLGRSPEANTKGWEESIKRGSNCYNFRYPPTSPSPDHAPLTLLNPPKSWDSSAIYHVQFGGELSEILWMRRKNGHNHVYFHEFFMLFLETQTYESPSLLRALWIFFYIFLSSVGGLRPTMTQTWHFETKFPQISEKPIKCRTPSILHISSSCKLHYSRRINHNLTSYWS